MLTKADSGETGMFHQGLSTVESVDGRDRERRDSGATPVETRAVIQVQGDELRRYRNIDSAASDFLPAPPVKPVVAKSTDDPV
jgi:hypothetical protein